MIELSILERYNLDINPESALQIMPELKEDYLKDNPCKWKKGRIALLEVARARIEDWDPSFDTYSILSTMVFFDKKGKHRYFTRSEKTMQEQISAFDQQFGVIHKLNCTINDKDGNTDVKVRLFQTSLKIHFLVNHIYSPKELENLL